MPISSLPRIRRLLACAVLALFLGALLVRSWGEELLPILGLTQPGMLLAAAAAGGSALYLSLLAAHGLLALFFGRVFCSWLCPLGILQDIVWRLFHKKSPPSGKSAARPHRPRHNYSQGTPWRYAAPLLLTGSLFVLGPWLYGLAEPYSLFTRAGQSAGQPLYAALFNGLALLGEAGGLFLLPFLPLHLDGAGLLLALPPLFLVLHLAHTRGRGYCNSICPVGALLGLAGGAALLRPRFTSRCTACGLCEGVCKAHCLNPRSALLDASRCVACYNCLEACPRGGLGFLPGKLPASSLSLAAVSLPPQTPATPFPKAVSSPFPPGCAHASPAPPATRQATPAHEPGFMPGRAFFLRASLCSAALLLLQPLSRAGGLFHPAKSTGATAPFSPPHAPEQSFTPGLTRHILPVLPPGARSLKFFERRCTGCHTCISACPPGVLSVSGPFAWEQAGLSRMALPAMDFFQAFCQVGCTLCTQVCPTGALLPVSAERKKRLQLGQAVFVESLCIVITQKTRCGACAEHCPTGALLMTPPPGGGADLPRIDHTLCIGCGACQYACPVRPVQAVEVFALAEHSTAAAPRPREKNDIEAGEVFPF